MTHHTDAERAEFEKLWAERPIYMGQDHQKELALHWWQAARRAPAAPVPQGVVEPIETVKYWRDAYANPQGDEHFMGHGMVVKIFDDYLGMLAAAPQPPEAAPVPQFSRIAQKKLDYLLEAGEAITGYAIENKDGRRGAIDCHGFVYWWQDAAAPQLLANHGIQEQST